MESNHPKHRNCNHLHPIGGGGVSAKTPDTNSLDGINTLNSTPDAKSSSGFIQQINRLSEQEAIAQGYTVIKTAQDLDNIRNDLDGKYILMNDIDLSSYSNWDPIGEIDMDTGTGQGFTGTLDGNGYTISNLTINRPDEDGVGLFGFVGDTTGAAATEIKNLGLENVDVTGNGMIGGIAGFSSANIANCYTTGSVTGSLVDINVYGFGGLVGLSTGNILNSYSQANVSGGIYVGGLVGSLSLGVIANSYSEGSVVAGQHGGGLVGANFASINNCYSTSNVTGAFVGALVGNSQDAVITDSYAVGLVDGTYLESGITGLSGANNTVSNCIWDIQTTGQSVGVVDSVGSDVTGTSNKGLTTSEMQNPANWSGWDTSVWDFSTYPPTFKMYTPVGGGSTGGGTGGTDPSDPSNPDNPNTPGGGTGGAGDEPIPGAVRLQIGSDSSSTSAIYVDTSFDLGAFDVDFSSADSCAEAIEDIDEVLSRINTKRSEFGAVINRLSSILESQTTTIQNFTSAQSTIMDADIANESADFVKNQILQQTSSALLAQSQNLHASIVLSLIG